MKALVEFGGRVRECEVVKVKGLRTEVKIGWLTVAVFTRHVVLAPVEAVAV